MEIKNENYIVTYGWMIKELDLKGSTLLTYALIYGFHQNNGAEYTGSINYLCKWLNCTKNTARRALKELTERKLITKKTKYINNQTFCSYSAAPISFDGSDFTPPAQKVPATSADSASDDSAESEPNNTNINNPINKEDFLNDWNELRQEHLGKPSFLNNLTREDKKILVELSQDYKRSQFQEALIGLFKQKQMPNDNTVMQSNPKHFLNYFNTYLTAYHDKNSSLYGKEKQLEGI